MGNVQLRFVIIIIIYSAAYNYNEGQIRPSCDYLSVTMIHGETLYYRRNTQILVCGWLPSLGIWVAVAAFGSWLAIHIHQVNYRSKCQVAARRSGLPKTGFTVLLLVAHYKSVAGTSLYHNGSTVYRHC